MTNYLNKAKLLLGKGRSPKAWLKAFYPIKASTVSQIPTITVDELLLHSYSKWLGLLPEILERCRLVSIGGGLYEQKTLLGKIYTSDTAIVRVEAISCTLCWAYTRNYNCTICPIKEMRNGVRCYQLTEDELVSPWSMWTRNRNPIPMLETLEKARDWAKINPSYYKGVQYQR
jgi:hypothetical protein